MITAILVLALAVLAADALYARARLALRRRAASQPQRPAWDVMRGTREGWRPLETQGRSADAPETGSADLGRLFGRRGR